MLRAWSAGRVTSTMHKYKKDDGGMMTGPEIKAKWDHDRMEAANKGTWLHLQAELFLNNVEPHLEGQDMILFLRFIKSMSGYNGVSHRVGDLRRGAHARRIGRFGGQVTVWWICDYRLEAHCGLGQQGVCEE